MFIKYANGTTVEGTILSRIGNSISVAVKGGDDVAKFSVVNDRMWASEDCEPIEIEFAWERQPRKEAVLESDCICSKEFAARLIHALLSGSEVELPESAPEPWASETASGWDLNQTLVS